MSAITEVTGLDSYVEAFSGVQQRTSRQSEWLRVLRDAAFAQFCAMGFPTLKDEAWRFTSVAPISHETFSPIESESMYPNLEDLKSFLISDAACRLVFVNGRFASALSHCEQLPAGVTAGSLAAEIDRDPVSLESDLKRYLALRPDSFCNLNTAFLEDGAYVRIRRGVATTTPIHLLFVSVSGDTPGMAHPHNLIIAERDAQADIVEEYVSLGDRKFFWNTATELVAAENSAISHHLLECENRKSFHISTLRIHQERNARVASHSLLIGGALVRNNVHPVLAGADGECLINGLFLGDDNQHLDNYMLVEHASPHCSSRQFYNGILGGSSHGVFQGRIVVQKNAQKTDAKQTNRNLLLSDDAQVDTKPQLEIYADDVKCTHGATIGQIDEKALYYLRSRGLGETMARELLLLAFAGECTGHVQSVPVREYMERIVLQSLPRAMQGCTKECAEKR